MKLVHVESVAFYKVLLFSVKSYTRSKTCLLMKKLFLVVNKILLHLSGVQYTYYLLLIKAGLNLVTSLHLYTGLPGKQYFIK